MRKFEQFMQNSVDSQSPKTWPQQQQKRQTFRHQIRGRQIQSLKKQIRMKYYHFTDPNDYELLKNINLGQLLHQCKYSSRISQDVVHGMFLYASSQNSDHLFSLCDDSIIDKLLLNLIQEQIEQPILQIRWNRKILWILTNYTSYSQIINEEYIKILLKISRYTFNNERQPNVAFNPHLHLQQTEQSIVISLSNLFIQSKHSRIVLQCHPELLNLLIQHFLTRRPSILELIANNPSRVPSIVYDYCKLFNNLYTAVDYYEIGEPRLCKKLFKCFVKMLDAFLGNKMAGDKGKEVVLIILATIKQIFGNSLDNQPSLIIQLRKYIETLAIWFENFVKSQSLSNKNDQIIREYLIILAIIYGPNIPQQNQIQITKFYKKFFSNHAGIVCTSLFMNKNPLFHTYTLKLLQPILMQQCLAQLIITQYLPIVSHIFYHIKNSQFAQRKQALQCLVNLIKSTMYDQSSTSTQVLQLLLCNQVSDIFAFNLWSFVDTDLNLQLLNGVQILIQADKNQYAAKLKFLQQFTLAGGLIKMQRILQQSSNCVLKDETIKILDSIKSIMNQS